MSFTPNELIGLIPKGAVACICRLNCVAKPAKVSIDSVGNE